MLSVNPGLQKPPQPIVAEVRGNLQAALNDNDRFSRLPVEFMRQTVEMPPNRQVER